ncbi:MAG: glycosyltransferase [Deltaproteobacteria bacterium]|nr:glycosyltransferase [Deltaproteobacteria bacterium]
MQPLAFLFLLLTAIIDCFWLRALWVIWWGVRRWPFAKIAKNTDKPTSEESPKIAVFIPARNEQERVEKALSSVLAQDYPNFSVRFIDDQSTDKTWEIASRLARGCNRLELFRGKSRPEGWLGKPWALHQITQGVTEDWFLFVDADVVLHPQALSRAMDEAERYGSDLLSILVTVRLQSFWQKVIGLTTAAIVAVTSPIAYVNDPKKKTAFAAGGFMLFRRDAYQAVGGHAAVKDQIVEDVALAYKVKKRNLRLVLLSAPELVSTHFFGGFNEIWRNLRKNFFGLFGVHPGKLSLYSLWLLMWVLLPWFGLVAGISFSIRFESSIEWRAVAAFSFIGVASLLGMTGVFALLARSSPLYALTVPLGVCVLLAISWSNAWMFYFGSGLEWKGRTVAMK